MAVDVKIEAEFLASILQNTGLVEPDVLSFVEPGHFQADSYQWLTKKLQERSWQPIAFDLVDHMVQDEITDPETQYKYRSQIYALFQRELTFEHDASKIFRGHIAYATLNSELSDALQAYNRSGRVDYLIQQVRQGSLDAEQVLEGNKLDILDYAADYVERQERRRTLRDNPNLNPRVMTGINGVDRQLFIRAPMLVDFIAPFKRYKSIFLNAIGFSALLQGFNVLHVTFENTIDMTADRYDAMFSNLNYQRIKGLLLTQAEKDAMDQTFGWINNWSSRINIVKATAEETTVLEVEEETDRRGFSPDVEVWDYLNLIAPSKRPGRGEERREQKISVWDLKRHAEKKNRAIITASQANMEGVKAERIQLFHRGKSIDISQALDASIAIDQTEEEKAEGIIVLSPQFIRDGKITVPEIVLDSDISRMCVARELQKMWSTAVKVHPYDKRQSA